MKALITATQVALLCDALRARRLSLSSVIDGLAALEMSDRVDIAHTLSGMRSDVDELSAVIDEFEQLWPSACRVGALQIAVADEGART